MTNSNVQATETTQATQTESMSVLDMITNGVDVEATATQTQVAPGQVDQDNITDPAKMAAFGEDLWGNMGVPPLDKEAQPEHPTFPARNTNANQGNQPQMQAQTQTQFQAQFQPQMQPQMQQAQQSTGFTQSSPWDSVYRQQSFANQYQHQEQIRLAQERQYFAIESLVKDRLVEYITNLDSDEKLPATLWISSTVQLRRNLAPALLAYYCDQPIAELVLPLVEHVMANSRYDGRSEDLYVMAAVVGNYAANLPDQNLEDVVARLNELAVAVNSTHALNLSINDIINNPGC